MADLTQQVQLKLFSRLKEMDEGVFRSKVEQCYLKKAAELEGAPEDTKLKFRQFMEGMTKESFAQTIMQVLPSMPAASLQRMHETLASEDFSPEALMSQF